jgi:hypothetical protein
MDNHLDEARRLVENLARDLRSSIAAADLGVRPKTPFLLLWAREALSWRTEELARCACDLLARNDVAAGILLTRGVIESAAFIWRLKELLEERDKYSLADLHDKFEKLLVGWKNDPEFPQVDSSILTMIDRMDRRLPGIGIRQRYDDFSEFAHPNWCGVSGLFSIANRETHTVQFGRDLDKRTPAAAKESATIALRSFLELFRFAYNSISDKLPEFIAELEPL